VVTAKLAASLGNAVSLSSLREKPSSVTRRPSTPTSELSVWTSESMLWMKSATWKKLPVKFRLYGITPSPAGPIVAPNGSNAASASVGGTVADAGTAVVALASWPSPAVAGAASPPSEERVRLLKRTPVRSAT
jgi:hypothetical protein